MTLLTGQYPAATYGDLITCTNGGMGLTNILQNIQDGLGNNSAIQLSTLVLNVTGTLEIGGIPITSSVSNINSVTQTNPIFPGNYVTIPSHTTSQRPAIPQIGVMGFNTTLGTMEYWNGATWISF